MPENLYEFVTGLQDGWMTHCGWGHPRGTGTLRTRPWYWTGYRAATETDAARGLVMPLGRVWPR